ncbi:MAG TPA: 2-oxo acid dehydrogenase subunit E2 [Ktedonobacterales bacterium]|jgi:pyruvate/2-oxoglutarate dehydrogenase complex dihydrolipoamide acyltransferase (E2) component
MQGSSQHIDTDHQALPFSKLRQVMAAAYQSVRHRPMIHGLVEVDVTRARAFLREYKATTGESLSFTAFLIACLGKAVEEDKTVQAFRKGGKRLVVFDDVDVNMPVEREVDGQHQLMIVIIRAANRKTIRAIHDEIRAAQAADVTKALTWLRFVPRVLFRPYMWLFWRISSAYPRFRKKHLGTVGITAIGMVGKGAGWGIPSPSPTSLMVTVGGIGEKHTTVDGQSAPREYLCLTVSVDHDTVDGAPAARFTERLEELIESGYGLDATLLDARLASELPVG